MKKFYLNLQQYVSKTVILFRTVLIAFMFGNSIFAQTTVDLTTPGSATWTVPCGVTALTIEAWGGGGAGGSATIIPSGGSGGGGGGYSTYTVIVTSGQIINYTVGSGGVGGIGNGGDGGATTILALTANGGTGGGQDMGAFGTGGTAAGGTTNTTGGNGIIGTTTTGEAGGNSTVAGTGGLAVTSESNGNNGIAPGGGGGGGLLLSGAGPSLGGNGANGQIKITYTQPVVNVPTPVTPAAGGVSICSGKSTNLNATSAGNTINWYTVPTGGTSIGSSASGANLSVSPTLNTTYYAEAVSPAGCVSATRAATGLVTVNPIAATATLVTPNTPINICNGSSINLNATSAGNTIYWFTVATGGANVGTSPSAANFLIAPSTNSTTTYYADARTALGCFSATRTATATVTASAPPTISVQPASPTAICAGTGTRTISITASGVTTYQWRRNGVDLTNTPPFSNVTTATLTITNPATTDSGTYTVMLNGSTCGLVSNNATLTVNATPSPPTAVTPNGPVVVCTSDGKTPLNATSVGNTIDWYTVSSGGSLVGSSASGANFQVSAPTATVYYAEARNSNGCVSPTRTATASVTSNVLPAITTQPATPAAACDGTGTVTISVAATGVTTYQWRRNGSPLSNVAPYSGVTTATLTITNPPIGDNGATFDVVLNNATCPVTSNTVTLTVNTTPSAPTLVTPNSTVTICGSGNINLNATSAGNTIYWYTVATLGSTIGNSNSGVNLSVTPPGGTTTYYAEARTPSGCSSLTRTATAAITVTPTPVVTVEFTEQQNDKTYSIAACGHIAAAENDIDVHSGNPAGVNATTFGPTATGQWQVSYDNQATWVNAPGPTSTTPQYLFDPAYTIFESTPGTYYFRLILTVNGCPGTSDVITLTVNGNPTLIPGSIATDQSSCTAPFNPAAFTQTAAATVATPISGYGFSYIWQSSTDNVNFTNIAGATASTYDSPNISVTTYFRRYAIYGSAGGGCSAVSNTITVLVGSLAAPTVGTITQPTCGVATGSVVLSGLPTPGSYTLTQTGTSGATTSLSGATTTVSGLAAGTYNFTVTQAGCASASGPSANVVINAQPVTPAAPTASVTAQPTCPTPKGTIVATVPAPAANVTYTLTGTSPVVAAVTQAGATFANLSPGAYSLTTTNTTSGCTSTAISLSINSVPSNPPAPTASVTVQPTCTTPTGTIVITAPAPNPNLTYTVTGTSPVVAAVTQAGGTFANLSPGTYSVTINNTLTVCTSSAVSLTVNPIPANPAAATASVNPQPTCTTPTGTIVITAPAPAANVTYTVMGTSPVVAAVTQASATFANLNPGTYSVTTTNTTTGCTSSAISLTVNAIPANPAAPTASVNPQPTCSVTTGTIVVTVPAPAANVTYTVTGTSPVVAAVTQASATFANLNPGTYSVTTTNTTTGCTSSAISLTVNTQPTTPAVPTLSSTAASCSADGTSTISNYAAGNTYTFTPTGPTVGSGGAISGMTIGTSYTVTSGNGSCTSAASASFSNAAQFPTPAVPTPSSTAASCSADGTSTISNYLAGNSYVFTPAGPTVGAGGAISGMTVGTSYTVTASSGGCTSAASASFSNAAQLPTPAVPTLSSTAASCSSDGTSTISNYLAGNSYVFTPAGPAVGAGGAISGMTVGTSYTVTSGNGSCTSAASASFSNAAQLPIPVVPTISSTAASCSADGTSTISNYVAGNTYVFTPAGPTVGAGGAISGMTVGTSYSVTSGNGSCISTVSASFSNVAQLQPPAVPSLTAGAINCNDVTANWTSLSNVTGYRIDVARDNIFTDILPAYNNLLLGSGVITENVTGLASGLTFYIRLRAENSCGTSPNSSTLTITTGTSATAFTTDLIQPTCVLATGTITVTESVVDPSDQYSFDDGATYQSSNVKSSLAAGTYKVKVKNTSGCETLATTVVLNAAAVTTYSGSWSNGLPDVLKKAIFTSNYTFTGDLQACSCEVNTGVTVTVNPGFSLILENGIDVLGTGSIIFENSSSLIQNNNAVNTGNITYKRDTTPVGKFDYTYWSSPVYPQTLLNVSPTTLFDKYLSWDAVGAKWKVEATGTVMEKGVGYIIRGPQGNTAPAVYTASFIGIPNNGSISYSIAGSGLSYLIGNPYPSALDADAFLAANPALDGTIYFWTHNTPVTNLKYNGNDYASYNGVGGTGTAAAINPGVNNSIPSGKIASGQAFFAKTNAAGTVTFENTMRLGAGGNNSQFFKGTKAKTSSVLKKHRIWLNLSNAEGAFKQLLVGYVTSATNGLDKRFDGVSLNANKYLDFYSINDNKNLSIQGRALPFDIMDQVPLGYKTTIEGTFTINIDQVDGILAYLPVFLEDKSTGIIVNLKKGGYSFSTAIGTFDDRFVLRYIDKSIKISDFAIPNFNDIDKSVLISVKNHNVKINSFDQTIDKVIVYDLIKRKLYEKENINNNEFSIPEFNSTEQFLIVQIRLQNGKWVTEKIVF